VTGLRFRWGLRRDSRPTLLWHLLTDVPEVTRRAVDLGVEQPSKLTERHRVFAALAGPGSMTPPSTLNAPVVPVPPTQPPVTAVGLDVKVPSTGSVPAVTEV
jgi:hypothetical protein